MTRVLILGAHGQVARVATRLFLERDDVELTLYLRNASRLGRQEDRPGVTIVAGDVLDTVALSAAVAGHDVVYANLDGRLEEQARVIVKTMNEAGVKRLIFVSSMGIHDETPGARHGSVLDPYRHSARIIEASNLDYTIVRPAWLNDHDEIAYGTTLKDEPFKNSEATVSRKSVADLIVRLATAPHEGIRQSIGVHAA